MTNVLSYQQEKRREKAKQTNLLYALNVRSIYVNMITTVIYLGNSERKYRHVE